MNSVLALPNHNFGPLTQFLLFLMCIASVFMITFAASAGGYLIPAAVAASTYTVATVNNAFEHRMNANLFKVVGSHCGSLVMMLTIIIMLKKAPTSPQSVFAIFASLPFLLEGAISIASLCTSNRDNANVIIADEHIERNIVAPS